MWWCASLVVRDMKIALNKIGLRVAGGTVLALIVIAAMAWLAGAFRPGKIPPGELAIPGRPVAGTVVVARAAERPRDAVVVGSVQSEVRTSIAARIIANVVEMRVNAGDHVKRGEVLVVLDDAAPKARVEQARELLRSAEANRSLAQTELDRINVLRPTGAISRSQIDEWETKKAVAEADVARAKQAVVESEVGLEDAQLRAPFDGVVIDRSAEPGEQAYPGRPLLTVYDPSRLRLEASVPESYVGRLHAGQAASVYIEAVSQARAGRVEQIVPASDPNSRSFLVKVHLDDPAGLYPGMYGRMRVVLGTERRIEVPRAAVSEVGQLAFVDVVQAGRARRRAVRLGQAEGATVEVLAGLRDGEQIVIGE